MDAKPEVLIYQLLDKIAMKFQRLPYVFGVHELSDTVVDTARCNRKSKTHDGGRCTERTYIWASREGGDKTQTAMPMTYVTSVKQQIVSLSSETTKSAHFQGHL